MVGRRQLREKVVETLYSYQQNPQEIEVVLNNMMMKINKIYDLYVYELNFLLTLRDLAEEQIEIAKNKYIKSEEDLNPNRKFVENRVLKQIAENEERQNYTEKNNQLTWDLDDGTIRRTFQRIRTGKRYRDYMSSPESSFEEDQKFIGKLFLRYIAENIELHEFFESKEISWADDFHIANSLVQRTIGFFKPSEATHTLLKVFKDKEDENFVTTLLTRAIENKEEQEKKLDARLQNWDLERVSVMDKVILLAALCEMDYFKSTPSTIIMNEYIEIAKVFSSEKSNIFINGILDKYAKDHNRI